jgi:hypothetical protein
MTRLLRYLFVVFLALAISAQPAFAQLPTGVLLLQNSDFSPVESLPPQERDALADPFFNLVLRNSANVTSLSAIEDLIQPDQARRQTFVVHERIADPSLGQTRRAVLSYSGRNGAEQLNGNLMLSVSFNSNEFPEQQDIEAWGWDRRQGRYNYYKLDSRGTNTPSWKFRGSSVDAELLTVSQRRGSCMQCHVNGAPVMRELLRPWNNWHSLDFPVAYLDAAGDPNRSWPVAKDDRIDGRLRGAEDLERTIAASIRDFNRSRISKRIRVDDNGTPAIDPDGRQEVIDGKALLRPLFETTEYNIISADRILSGLHPFPAPTAVGPVSEVNVPNSFFLNSNLMRGGGPLQYTGLEISESLSFNSTAVLAPAEYRDLVIQSQPRLGDQSPADTVFAWFVPEPSHIDNDLVDQLMQRGILTPEFVAAVLAIDLDTPILSQKRRELLNLIPDEFRFLPLNGGDPFRPSRHPDNFTSSVINRLQALSPDPGSPEAEFLEILQSSNPTILLQDRIKGYVADIAARLDQADPPSRQLEIKRLYDLAISRRQAVATDPSFSALNDESSGLLFPLP